MTITPADAQLSANEKLNGFPPAVAESYVAFAESRDVTRLDHVVLGVLQFYLAKPPAQPLAELPGSTRLVEDLGCDSLTMVDTLFLAESLFNIRLADDEMARVSTLDDLRGHFQRHIMGHAVVTA
jgi:acyl carrier protein